MMHSRRGRSRGLNTLEVWYLGGGSPFKRLIKNYCKVNFPLRRRNEKMIGMRTIREINEINNTIDKKEKWGSPSNPEANEFSLTKVVWTHSPVAAEISENFSPITTIGLVNTSKVSSSLKCCCSCWSAADLRATLDRKPPLSWKSLDTLELGEHFGGVIPSQPPSSLRHNVT